MPKIILPEKVKCHECKGYIFGFPSCSNCEDGYRWDLGDLYRAVEDAGAIPGTALRPAEGKPDYVAAIQTCDSRHVARGDSHEEAMV
ncbi:MAG TPA: hypothetical protein VMX79_10430, partial [bacterium]|nr:hypothetical protein [bacterium]